MDLAALPALAKLHLGVAELELLRRQGTLHFEQRAGGKYCWLRYRANGRQRTKYIPAAEVSRVATELAQLQAPTKRAHRLWKTSRAASELLRRLKRELTPVVSEYGFQFHGLCLRQTRVRAAVIPQQGGTL